MKKFIFGASFIIFGVAIGMWIKPIPMISSDNIFEDLKKFDYIFNTAYRNYVDEVDSGKLIEYAINGMLSSLDPHSLYFSAEEQKKEKESFQGSFDGIGVEFAMINDTITIVAPIADGPSEKLGIQAGDKIVKIDGENAVGIEQDKVPKRLKGPKGTKVAVDIKRSGVKELLHYDITRDKIPLTTVNAKFMIDKSDIGYIQIDRFAATTHEEMMDAVHYLKSKGMKKMILDLRGNPGGYLTQAFEMADEFLKNGDTIVYTKSRRKEFDETYMSSNAGELENIPLIVMVDQGSASASEIVSGSIQDLDRGLIVGTTSFGKGLVQRQYDVPDGSAFRITISRYYTPSGRSIQRPYKDKDDYRKLVGRLELEEGANLAHTLEKIKLEQKANSKDPKEKGKINIDSLAIHYTKTGRVVLGGGGITPDYTVKGDTSKLTALTTAFWRKNLFTEFISSYINSADGKELKAKYQNNFTEYFRNYEIDVATYNKFIALAKQKVVDTDEEVTDKDGKKEPKEKLWKEENLKKDEVWIKTRLKANMARIFWDRSAENQINISSFDRQLKKALDLFPEAEKIQKSRR